MADKDVKREATSAERPAEKSQKTEPITTRTAAEKATNGNGAQAFSENARQMWVIWVVIVGFVVLILLVVAAIVIAHHVRENTMANQTQVTTPRDRFGYGSGYGGGYPNGSFYSQTSNSDGLTTTTTTTRYTYTTGVVTQVNNGNIVVAGNGKAQTIATNSSTTYDNDTKPAVNDTVYVVGTADSNGNITATEVQVVDN